MGTVVLKTNERVDQENECYNIYKDFGDDSNHDDEIKKDNNLKESLAVTIYTIVCSGLQVPFDPKIGHFIGPYVLKIRVK